MASLKAGKHSQAPLVGEGTSFGAEPAQEATEKQILTVREAAALLQVSPRTVERYVEESRIPYFRLQRGKRGSVRFLRSQLLEWLRRLAVKPIQY